MSAHFRCTRGHTWSGPASAPGVAVRCPFCGAPTPTPGDDRTAADPTPPAPAGTIQIGSPDRRRPTPARFDQPTTPDATAASLTRPPSVIPPAASATQVSATPPPAADATEAFDPGVTRPPTREPALPPTAKLLAPPPPPPPAEATEEIALTVAPRVTRPSLPDTAPIILPTETVTVPPRPSSAASRTEPLDGGSAPDAGTETLPAETAARATARSSAIPVVGVGTAPPGYEVLGELGRGGMGVVYKARDRKLNRTVALKMILAGGYASRDEIDRFRAEAEAIARIDHPHIVHIFEIGEHGGRPYITLEYCDGGSLSQKIAGTPQPPAAAAAMAAKLARGMAAAHAKNIIHRDLKPGNVLLASDGTPKITDFGLAKKLDADVSSQTHTGAILGTPSYMSPEQASGKAKSVGPLADVWALGAILYDLLTGRPPFKADTAMNTVMSVIHDEPAPPTRLLPKVPKDLETICLKCLEKDPAKRYPSASALADDLDRFLDDRPISARPVGSAERVWKWAKRRPAIAGLLAALAVSVVGGLVGVTALWLEAVNEKRIADDQRKEADRQRGIADAEKQIADDQRKVAVTEKERAEKEQARAEGEQKRAETEKARAERETAEAVAQKKRADQFFAEAQQVIEALTHVGQVDLADTPGAEAVRRKVLGQALGFFQQLSADPSADPALRGQVARAALLVADLHESLGEQAKARAAYQQAADLYAKLPDSPAARAGRAAADNNLAILLQSTGDPKDREKAAELYARAVAAKEALARESPGDSAYRRSLAQSYNNLATFHQITGDRTKAAEFFRKALTELETLAKTPGRPEDRRELALALGNYGTFLQTGGDVIGAADAYARTEAVQRDLVGTSPAPVYRKELARTLLNSGSLLQQTDAKPDQAVAKYDAAIDLLTELARDFPLAADYRTELAVALRNRGLLHRRRDAVESAAADYRRAADLLAPLATPGAGAVTPRLEYVRALGERAQLAAADPRTARDAEGIWAKAVEAADGFRKAAPTEPGFAREQARLVGNLGLFLAARGPDRAADAEQKLRQAADLFAECEKAAAGDPELIDRCAADRAYFTAARARVAADRGDAASATGAWADVFKTLDAVAGRTGYAHAGRVVGQLAAAAGKDWPHAAAAAGVAAKVAGRAASDPALAEPHRRKLADAYAGVALDLLRKLKAAGKLDREWLTTAEALAPLRGRADFKAEFGSLPPGTER